ncbi:hypothetical protein Tco_0761872 [Tanacetum coccineum]|uniref:Reverse transcriptase domain-containing protein n=1 Tax=Tanacetum coccineum TaxID=301880 RepID=A0ABQ5AZ34_9ASTR
MGAPYHNQDKQQTYLILPRLQHYRDRDAFTKVRKIDQAMNDEALLLKLDVLEEEREKAVIEEAKSKAEMEQYYNVKVRNTIIKPGDFLYRNNKASHAKESGKLGPKWEGPYEVVEALEKGAYKLRNGNRDILP